MRRSFLVVLALISALTGCSSAFSWLPWVAPEPFPPISDPAVHHGVLENGLTYFIRANHEPRNRAELRLVVNAGSILEDNDQRGLAHMVEHMAFNGTRSFEGDDIVGYLESIGMRFGPDVNAYTSFDETVYMLTLPTDSADVLEKGLRILEEWAWQISFDSTQVEQERKVVKEEWRLGQGAASRLQYQQFPTLTQRSRYAERLPIGTPESLDTFSHAALERFYDDWYRPDLMAVVVVGDVDVERIEGLIREYFGQIPPRVDEREREEYGVPGHPNTLISVATDPELTSSSVSLYLKRQPTEWRDVRAYRNWVVESLATSMLIKRLSEKTQEIDSPFLDVSSFHGRFVRTLSTFSITTRTPPNGVELGLQSLLVEVERAARFGFTESELAREKRELMRVMQQRYAERDRITSGSLAADYVSFFLYGGTIMPAEQEYQLYRDLIPRISLDEADDVARTWTSIANRVLLISAPARDSIAPPRESILSRIVELVPERRLTAYRDSVSEAPLIPDPPEGGEIVAEREIPEIGVEVWELSNGSRIVLKQTDFREDEVLFAGRSPGGTSLVNDEDYIAALTAAAVVQSGGLGDLSPNNLRKRLAGTVAGVGADISDYYEGLSGAASPLDLEILFQLIYLKFTAPRVDTAAFLAYQEQARAAVANRSASPDLAFQDTLRATLSGHHPRARPPSVAMFDALDLERSYEIYRDRFADASDFTFLLVGNFDVEEVRPLVRRYLASLPDLGRVERGRDVGIRPPTGIVEKTVYRGIEPRAATQLVFTGPIEFSKRNVIAMQSLADLLRLRLRERLREDLGGTYGVSVRGSAARDPVARYQFSIGFGSDPHRVDELVDAVFDEIRDVQNSGPRDGELQKVREMQYRDLETNLRDNHFWLNQLLTYSRYGWDLTDIPTTADGGLVATPDMIQNAAREYLDATNYVRVSLMPDPTRVAAGTSGETEPQP